MACLEMLDRQLQIARAAAVQEVAPLQVQVIRLLGRLPPPEEHPGLAGQEPDLQLLDHAEGDLILDGEDVVGASVEALRPQVVPVGHVDELDGDAQPLPGLAHAAFQHRLDAEPAPDLPHVLELALEGE